MARCLIYTFGTRGDVQPYAALGSALRKHGHDVTVCTGQGFDTLVEAQGLSARGLSIDYRNLLGHPAVREAMTSLRGKLRAFGAMRSMMRQQYDEMWSVAKDVRPDLLVMSPKGFAATHIARRLQVPCVSTTLQPNFTPTREFPQFLFPKSLGALGNRLSYRAFNRMTLLGQNKSLGDWPQRALQLDKTAAITGFAGYHPAGRQLPILHAYSRHLVPKPADWGDRELVTGYWFGGPDPTYRPPPSLRAFLENGPPPVYVGFGSMPSDESARITRTVVAALRAAGTRGVLASGWGGLASTVEGDDMYACESVRHDWLFPRCAAVVHHGGAGTTHEGLRWGIPTVVCPLGLDQTFWGHRVASLGVGPSPVPLSKLAVGRLTDALRVALDPECVARSGSLGAAIRDEAGAELAAQQLSQLVP